MEIPKIIAGLKDLAKDRKTFFRTDGDNEIFRHDYAVCMAAIEAISNLQMVIDHPGIGVCAICKYGPEDIKGKHCKQCFRISGDGKKDMLKLCQNKKDGEQE